MKGYPLYIGVCRYIFSTRRRLRDLIKKVHNPFRHRSAIDQRPESVIEMFQGDCALFYLVRDIKTGIHTKRLEITLSMTHSSEPLR